MKRRALITLRIEVAEHRCRWLACRCQEGNPTTGTAVCCARAPAV